MNALLRKIRARVVKICRNPLFAMSVAWALLRGSWYIVRYSLFNNRIKIAFPFLAFAPVVLKGPGFISIDKGCSAHLNVFDGLTIITFGSRAKVFIGKKCGLGGLTIRCSSRVQIGCKCMTATSLIQDSIIINPARKGSFANAASMKPLPVSIGNNVWLGGQSCVLRGSRIGNDCVLAAGSLTHDTEIGEYRLVMGNPSAATIPIDKLIALEGRA